MFIYEQSESESDTGSAHRNIKNFHNQIQESRPFDFSQNIKLHFFAKQVALISLIHFNIRKEGVFVANQQYLPV